MNATPCDLCQCDVAYNFHHFIPRTLHSNKWFKKRYSREEMRRGIHLCRQCHGTVHRMIPDEKELGRHYNTMQALLEHPEVEKYVRWKRRKGV